MKSTKRDTTKTAADGAELPTISFATPRAFFDWLAEHHASSRGIWLRLAKKAAGTASITYAEAIDVALAWGWIDGQKRRADEVSWLQKFTPRGSRSVWSKVNREKALALIEAGAMQPAGLAEVERAKQDGRWDAAYDPPSRATVPDDLGAALAKNARAAAFSPRWTRGIGTRCCGGCRRRRSLRRAGSGSQSSSRCSHAGRKYIPERRPHAYHHPSLSLPISRDGTILSLL